MTVAFGIGLKAADNPLNLCVQCPTLGICGEYNNNAMYSYDRHCFGKEPSLRSKIAAEAEAAKPWSGSAAYSNPSQTK